MSAKSVILTAIKFKGTEQVRKEAKQLADDCLCSVGHVRSIVRKVENGDILVY